MTVVIGELGSTYYSLTTHLADNFDDSPELFVHKNALLGTIHYLHHSQYYIQVQTSKHLLCCIWYLIACQLSLENENN